VHILRVLRQRRRKAVGSVHDGASNDRWSAIIVPRQVRLRRILLLLLHRRRLVALMWELVHLLLLHRRRQDPAALLLLGVAERQKRVLVALHLAATGCTAAGRGSVLVVLRELVRVLMGWWQRLVLLLLH
jgi:hypothetical protein